MPTINQNFERPFAKKSKLIQKTDMRTFEAIGPLGLTYSTGVTKKHQKFIFEYLVFSQKSYLNMWCFEKVHICIPKIPYLHT